MVSNQAENAFQKIAADIPVRPTDVPEYEIKLRNFLKSPAKSALMVLPLGGISTEKNIREVDTTTADFRDLVASIRKVGVVQPPVLSVRLEGESLELTCVVGHRRLFAAREAGHESLMCQIRKFEDPHIQLVATVVENTHRKNLHPFELAEGIRRLVESGYSFEELETLFDRNQWNLRRFNKMNDWTEFSKRLVREHSQKFTPTFLLHLAAKKATPAEIEMDLRKKLGLTEDTKERKASLRSRFSAYCQQRELSDEQKALVEETLTALGLMKTPKRAASSEN